MEDTKIIELYFARDEQALRETEAAYGGRLFRLSNHIVRSREDAEECVNDTYWKTWRAIPPTRPQYFFAFLAKICRNLCLDKLDYTGAEKRRGELLALTAELEQCLPGRTGEPWEETALTEALNSFLAALSRENRTLFLRRYWFGDSVSELAGHWGLREGAVATRLHRLRKQLAIHLEKEGFGP